jgi:hypothetical protein
MNAATPERHAARHPYTPVRGSAAHSGSTHLGHAKSFSSTTLNPPARVATPDHRQADYFLHMLTDTYRLIEHRIDKYRLEIALCGATGDVDRARAYRRMMRSDERERLAVKKLVDNLRRRFYVDAGDEVPLISRRARLGVR